MIKKDHLAHLVNAMTKSEKRYLTLFAGLQKKDNQYLELFNLINSGKLADAKSDGAPSYKQSQQRKYLGEQILRALRLYHENLSQNIIIQNGLSEIEVLYEKRQGFFCQEKIREVKELAQKYEKFGLLLQIYEWERKLKYILDKPERNETEISADENITLQKKLNVLNYERLFGITLEFKKKYGFVKGKHLEDLRREVIEHPLMADRNECKSSKALFYFLYGNTLCRWITLDHVGAYRLSGELIHLDPKLIGDEEFFNGYLEHITSCVCMGYYDEVLSLLGNAEKLLEAKIIHPHPLLRIRLFYYWSNYSLLAYLNKGERAMLQKAVHEVERGLDEFDSLVNEEIKVIINSSLRNAYFFLGNNKKALEKMNDIMMQASESFRKDVYEDTILFSLLYWMEMKDSDMFLSALNSARRYFQLQRKNIDQPNELEMQIINILKSVKDVHNDKSVEEAYSRIESAILMESHQDGMNNYVEHLYTLLFWIRSRHRGTDYFTEARTWYEAHMRAKKKHE